MFYSQIEVGARRLLNDAGGPTRRYSKADFVDWITQALRQHALLRPDLFVQETELTAAGATSPFKTGRIYHEGPPASLRVMDVLEYKAASSRFWIGVNEVDYPQMVDQGLISRAAGSRSTTIPRGILFGGSVDDQSTLRSEWARHPKSPNRFFFSPAPERGALLRVEYSRIPDAAPPDYGQTTEVPILSDSYLSTMIHCVVWLAESVNDSSILKERAQMYLSSFTQALGAELQARSLTDQGEVEEGGQMRDSRRDTSRTDE